MISFSCSHCGLKLKVKPEFAGRSSKCPTCKQPLVVPAPDKTEVAAGQIDGTDSSLAKVGHDGGVTLAFAGRSGSKPVSELLARRTKKDGRYLVEQEIARGGMGAVLRAVDCDIRREVAVKYLLDQSDAGKKARFIEEAQITGQLEHPNIPPIHELGVDTQKRLFFSMKMVKGRSLAQVLDELRQNPKSAQKEWSLPRLLNIFVSACNGLAYAHSRSVVHRDLKPANIMVGDFGEVYVMDWGLAKVLKGGGSAGAPPPVASAVSPNPRIAAPAAVPVPQSQNVSLTQSSKVATSRQPDADLTQEGAVLGTPVYMPPEQATGHLEAIDQRSDVYSLGAILYEMFALEPPIDKTDGYLAILVRVAQGEILPPEQRNPARAGQMPKEITAVAMKALAKNPKDRYPSVEALRRDIERFQEGRSVSAKEDSFREAAWKLVKRNKLASAFTAVLAVVLLWGFWINFQARRRAEELSESVRTRTEKAVPALVEAARLGVEKRKFPSAKEQVDLALAYAPDHAEARLLKGQLLVLDKKFTEAGTELDKYLRQRPEDGLAKKLRELCGRPRPNDEGNLMVMAKVLEQQETPTLAEALLKPFGPTSFEARKGLLKIYQDRIDAVWPGLGKRLSMDGSGLLALNFTECRQVTSLVPLEGMPLATLSLGGCGWVRDLRPLRSMPLTRLELAGCVQVTDLRPLADMSLAWLSLSHCGQVQDLTPLKGMKLTWLSLYYCRQVQDIGPLRGMPLTSLNLEECPISDLTPLQGMRLMEISLNQRPVYKTGLDVLRQMKSLRTIDIGYGRRLPADVFWKRYDAGEFTK